MFIVAQKLPFVSNTTWGGQERRGQNQSSGSGVLCPERGNLIKSTTSGAMALGTEKEREGWTSKYSGGCRTLEFSV
jgi:hypothetical protein